MSNDDFLEKWNADMERFSLARKREVERNKAYCKELVDSIVESIEIIYHEATGSWCDIGCMKCPVVEENEKCPVNGYYGDHGCLNATFEDDLRKACERFVNELYSDGMFI